MKKIPTIFMRDMTKQPALVTPEWNQNCLWVRDGEGTPTVKFDGTCCLIREGRLFKRREIREGDLIPAGFDETDRDLITRKVVGWVPVGDGPEDKYHREAFHGQEDGTYELVGPKVQGNKGCEVTHVLKRHGSVYVDDFERSFDSIRVWLDHNQVEGIVWHHPDGRMAKIKRRDFGFRW